MKEARIGSLSWFAGVFWLALATVGQRMTEFTIYRWPAVGLWAARGMLRFTVYCTTMAMRCAVDAGAEL